jgi:myo-inositol-1(or 4)-monophosphatase
VRPTKLCWLDDAQNRTTPEASTLNDCQTHTSQPGDGLAADFALLEDAVRQAGAIAMSYFRRPIARDLKSDGSEVSEADLAVDCFLKETLGGARPGYGWLSEESVDDRIRLRAERVWIVDPIDGTRAFLKGADEWAVSVALAERGEVVLSAVYNPASGEFFSARKGAGAILNGQPIKASGAERLEGARMAGSESLFRKSIWERPWPPMNAVWVYSIAYRICLAAMGRFDGAVSISNLNEWDVAAAVLVMREAGGIITLAAGKPITFNRERPRIAGIIAAGPGLHPLLEERIAPVAKMLQLDKK